MSSVVISGDTSGTVTVAAPAVAGSNTLTLQAGTGTNSMNTLATAVASTSGTSIDFTGLPSWVKRITVMLSGVSTNGTSNLLVQVGYSGGIETSGYLSGCGKAGASGSVATSTAGFLATQGVSAAFTQHCVMTINLVGSNIWVAAVSGANYTDGFGFAGGGSKTTTGTLDRVRITTVGGTDTFDAGSINILYEG